MKIKKGFTLLELLVVIGIIAILVSMGFASYSTAQKKARNAKRAADLSAVRSCLEQNYSSNSTNPYQYQVLATGTLTGSINCGGAITITAPTDPLGGTYFYHVVSSASDSYDITAVLEGGGSFEIKNQQ